MSFPQPTPSPRGNRLERLGRFLTYLSLRQQVVLFAALALAIILATLFIIGGRATRQANSRALVERLGRAEQLATTLDHGLAEITRLQQVEMAGVTLDFSETPTASGPDDNPTPQRQPLERAYRVTAHLVHGIALLDTQGVVRDIAGENPHVSQGDDLSSYASVQKALATGQSQTEMDESTQLVRVVTPLPGAGGKVAGLVLAYLDLSSKLLAELVDLAPAPPTYVTIVTRTGVVLASSSDSQPLFQHIAHTDNGKAFFSDLVGTGQPVTGTCYACHNGKRTPEVMVLAPLDQAPWAVVIREPEASFYAPVSDLRRNFLIAGVASLVAVLALAVAGMSLLTYRLRLLTAATRRLARGDLTTPSPALGRDEVGTLAQDFEVMRQQLKAAHETLEEKVRERTAALERRNRELTAVYAIDQAAVQKERQEEVLEIALASTMATLEADAGAIFLAREGDVLEMVVHRGHSEESLKSLKRCPLGEGLPGQAALQLRALASDLPGHPAPERVAAMRREGFLHFAAAPMLVGARLVGVVATGRRQDTPFSQEDLNLLQSVANQVAISLERFRLLRELERRSERRSAINRIARAISSNLEMHEIYSTLQVALSGVLPFDRLSIALLTPAGDALTILQPGEPDLKTPERQDLDDSPLGQVIRSSQPLVTTLEQESTYPVGRRLWGMGLRSTASVPLSAKGKILGTLNLMSRETGRYSEADMELLQPVADHLALALENARLLAEARDSVRRLEFLSEKLSERHAELQGAYQAMAASLIALLEARDPYTRGHSDRVRHYCRRIAIRLGLPPEEVAVLEQAAQLHDLGKIGVPDSVLSKKGPLEPPEMAEVRLHPEKTVELLRLLPFLLEALPVIKHHHERWDGTGYPDGLAREAIPLGARIMAVADAYDAMTSDRPYRAALSHAAALAELERGAGTAWDTQVLQAFLQVLQEERQEPRG